MTRQTMGSAARETRDPELPLRCPHLFVAAEDLHAVLYTFFAVEWSMNSQEILLISRIRVE